MLYNKSNKFKKSNKLKKVISSTYLNFNLNNIKSCN